MGLGLSINKSDFLLLAQLVGQTMLMIDHNSCCLLKIGYDRECANDKRYTCERSNDTFD